MSTLTTQERDIKISADVFRKQGLLPCVYYGPKEKPVPIAVNKIEFLKAWKEAGESTVITLNTGKKEIDVLIQDMSFDPVRNEVIHADFYVLEKGKVVEVYVPLDFVGVSKAVKDLSGILVKVLHEIEVEALPKDLPHTIAVDISALDGLDSQIFAKDLKLPSGVNLITEPEEVVAAISVAEEEVEEAPAADLSAIEVEKKGKKEEDGGEAKK
ncbi:MAG: 50S ribosomal protein L25 [Candidatus Paceibacterota bacterium]|nr:50S ribosomal protein L25 [Candidatus Paceibacterota bacterium]